MRWPGELAAAHEKTMGDESDLLGRITVCPDVFGGKPIIRDMRIAVEHVLGMLAAGDAAETVLREYPEPEPEDVRPRVRFAHRSVAGERCMTDCRSATLCKGIEDASEVGNRKVWRMGRSNRGHGTRGKPEPMMQGS